MRSRMALLRAPVPLRHPPIAVVRAGRASRGTPARPVGSIGRRTARRRHRAPRCRSLVLSPCSTVLATAARGKGVREGRPGRLRARVARVMVVAMAADATGHRERDAREQQEHRADREWYEVRATRSGAREEVGRCADRDHGVSSCSSRADRVLPFVETERRRFTLSERTRPTQVLVTPCSRGIRGVSRSRIALQLIRIIIVIGSLTCPVDPGSCPPSRCSRRSSSDLRGAALPPRARTTGESRWSPPRTSTATSRSDRRRKVDVTSVINDPDQDPHSYEADTRTSWPCRRRRSSSRTAAATTTSSTGCSSAADSSAKVINAVKVSGRTAPRAGSSTSTSGTTSPPSPSWPTASRRPWARPTPVTRRPSRRTPRRSRPS